MEQLLRSSGKNCSVRISDLQNRQRSFLFILQTSLAKFVYFDVRFKNDFSGHLLESREFFGYNVYWVRKLTGGHQFCRAKRSFCGIKIRSVSVIDMKYYIEVVYYGHNKQHYQDLRNEDR